MNDESKTPTVYFALTLVFCAMAMAFGLRLWGKPRPLPLNPLVDPGFIATTTIRTSYVQLIQLKADLSDFDCYGCHEKNKPPTLRFDTNQNLVVPQEHSDIVMGHGRMAGTTTASTAMTSATCSCSKPGTGAK